MHRLSRLVCRIGTIALVIGSSAIPAQDSLSHWPDPMFHHGFEALDAGPRSDADAARFLAQTTFGPTAADIQHLRDIGYRAWFDEQLAVPMTHEIDYLNWVASIPEPVYQNARVEAWWLGALGGPDPAMPTRIIRDQLRQRVAFALSEIFVISKVNGAVSGQVRSAAHYYDRLATHAFGNFRNLLEDVTLHPAMGHYLSMFKNRKPDLAENIRPDENYAREILQLFSIGLVELNPDGTPRLVGGQPVPTYNQTTVRGFAHVFTGWNWKNCYQGNSWDWQYCEPGPNGIYWLEPLEPVESIAAMRRRRGRVDDRDLCSGPGKLCQALGITRDLDGKMMPDSEVLVLAPTVQLPVEVAVTPRIGITKAADWPLRFLVAGNPHVSGRGVATAGRRKARA